MEENGWKIRRFKDGGEGRLLPGAWYWIPKLLSKTKWKSESSAPRYRKIHLAIPLPRNLGLKGILTYL